MAAAVFTACASLVVALVGFYVNQRSQLTMERRQALLARVNAQIQELYGPLLALSDVNETLWEALRESRLPTQQARRDPAPDDARQREEWERWLRHVFMPTNRQMKDLIVGNAHLIVEGTIPAPLLQFCAHVSAYEVVVAADAPADQHLRALVGHPGAPFVDYVRDRFAHLKAQQARLVERTGSD